jgi:hypothetical protein
MRPHILVDETDGERCFLPALSPREMSFQLFVAQGLLTRNWVQLSLHFVKITLLSESCREKDRLEFTDGKWDGQIALGEMILFSR